MRKLTEAQIKVLKDINGSVPKQWWGQLVKKVWAYPGVRELVDKGLKRPDLIDGVPGLREKLETMKKSEEYSATEDVIDSEVEKKIDEHITRKVRKAIKDGLLPPLTKDDFIQKGQKEIGTA